MRRFRFFIWAAAAIAVLGGVVLCAGLFALNSEAFAGWLARQIEQRSNGAVRVQSVSGTLGGDLRLNDLRVDFGTGSAMVDSASLRLDWRSLVARSLVLDYLSLGRLQVMVVPRPEDDATSQRGSSPDLSLLVLIREIGIDEIEVSTGQASYSLRDVSLGLRLLRNHLELDTLSAEYEDALLSGDLALTLAEETTLGADLCVDGVFAQERVLGCVEADGTLGSLQIDAQLQAPFAVTALGTVEPGDELFADLALTWQNAALAALPDFSSANGSAQVTGTLARLRVAADGSLAWREETAEFAAGLVAGADGIELERVRLEQGPASVEFAGSVSPQFDALEGLVDARGIDPERWLAGWPGDLDLRAQIAVGLRPALRVAANDLVVNGELREYPLAATGSLTYAQAALIIDALRIVSRTDQISVSGRIDDALDLDVTATMADLGLILPEVSGSLTADVEVSGTLEHPLVAGMLSSAGFSVDSVQASELQLAGEAGIAPSDPFELALSAEGLRIADTPLSGTLISVTGTAASHRLEARLSGEQWSASLGSDGALVERGWEGRMDRFEFVPGEFGLWRLGTPADIRYGAGGYSVSDLCLSYTLSRICAAVAVSGSSDDALDITAENFDIGILEPFMPAGIRARGLVDAHGALSNFIVDPRGEVEVSAADAQVDVDLAEGVVLPIPIEQLSLAALFEDSGMTVSASLSAAEAGSATAALTAGDPRRPDSMLQGSLSLQWHDAAVLGLLSPDVEEVAGQLSAQLTLGGTIAEPLYGGSMGWSNGSLTIPEWAVRIDDIVASADASDGNEALFEASGSIDGTPLSIDGMLVLDAEQGWPMQFRLKGDNLSLVQLADMEIYVSPDLEANVRLPGVEVTGTVRVPSAHIRELTVPQQAVLPSQDAIVYGRAEDERGRAIDVVASLTLELGDDVTYRTPSLDAAVTGRLDLDYRSGQGAAAEGALTVSGEYDAYGSPLALERGQLIFVGPLNDPSLDIRAVREIGEVTAGVQLSGTLRSPVTTLFSEPAMSEADALSWLLFGRPLDDMRESETGALRGAALSMGLQQAFPAIERIGASLGLDDFAIRSTETDAGALMAGKYISPNLYFRYSYGLFNRIGGLLLRYRITDRFSLETRSGEHNSMDILYTVEKD